MKKYRIVKIVGKLSKSESFIIEKRKRKLFGGYKWVVMKHITPYNLRKPITFNTAHEAKNVLDELTENYKKIYITYDRQEH